jgi:hypothetical protein
MPQDEVTEHGQEHLDDRLGNMPGHPGKAPRRSASDSADSERSPARANSGRRPRRGTGSCEPARLRSGRWLPAAEWSGPSWCPCCLCCRYAGQSRSCLWRGSGASSGWLPPPIDVRRHQRRSAGSGAGWTARPRLPEYQRAAWNALRTPTRASWPTLLHLWEPGVD